MKHLFSGGTSNNNVNKQARERTKKREEKDNASFYLFKYKCVVTRDCEENGKMPLVGKLGRQSFYSLTGEEKWKEDENKFQELIQFNSNLKYRIFFMSFKKNMKKVDQKFFLKF